MTGFSPFKKAVTMTAFYNFKFFPSYFLEVPVRPNLHIVSCAIRTPEVQVGIVSYALDQAVLDRLLDIIRNVSVQPPLPQGRIRDLR